MSKFRKLIIKPKDLHSLNLDYLNNTLLSSDLDKLKISTYKANAKITNRQGYIQCGTDKNFHKATNDIYMSDENNNRRLQFLEYNLTKYKNLILEKSVGFIVSL